MSRLLLLLVLVGVALWWLSGRRRRSPPRRPPGSLPKPQMMTTCGHCGVHLPRDEALVDAAGRTFCSEAHRLAGPR